MKIVHLTSAHPWNDIRIFQKMCRSLAAAGDQVTLIAADDEGARDEVVDGVRVLRVKKRAGRIARMTSTVSDVLSLAEQQDAELFHFHDPEILLRAGAFARRTRKVVVWDAHEDVRNQVKSKHWLPGPSRQLISRMVGYVEDRGVRSISGAIAATPVIARRFVGLREMAVVQNFPMLAEFSGASAGESADRRRFVYVGAISRIRGIGEMIEAIRLSRYDLRLSLAGRWQPPALRDEFSAQAAWAKVDERGQLGREETCALVGAAGCGLVVLHPEPNYLDSQPTKMFEYMAAGLPVISSNFPAWRQIVDQWRCGLLVDPLDPKAVAAAMDWMVEHPDEAKAMGQRGKAAVHSHYNWESEFPKLRAFYRQLIEGRKLLA